jgi:DNA polymerase-3 subunit delta
MKLAARDIEGFLRKPDAGAEAVLIYGPDAGLVRERAKAIAAYILGKNHDPINHMELTAEQLKADPALLRDELCALSLMAGRRVIGLRDAGDKTAAIIAEAFEGITTTTYLIVESDELSPSAALRSLFERESRFAALPCYRDEGRNLEETIRATLQGFGLSAARDAVAFLAENLGNDRGVTHSELEKIALYMGNAKELSLATAMELTGHNANVSMDDLCHSVACNDSRTAERLLSELLNEQVQPVAIIRSLLKHFQKLELLQAHVGSGMPADHAIAALRPPVFFKYVPLMKRELALWKPKAIARMLSHLLRTEKELKSSLLSPALLTGHALQQAARLAG